MVNSVNNIEVDGMPRHILDVRQVVEHDEEMVSSEDEIIVEDEPRYSTPNVTGVFRLIWRITFWNRDL